MNLGEAIRASRRHLKPPICQMELARRIGVTRQRMNAIECGRVIPKSMNLLGRLAEALEIPVWRLVQRAQKFE